MKRKLLALGLGTESFLEAEIQPSQFEYDSFSDCYLGNECKLLYIELTNNCNYNCIHCYAEIEKGNNEYLSPSSFDIVLSQLPTGCKCDIRLSGGEPFLNTNIKYFISKISQSIVPYSQHSIVTNGSFTISDAKFAIENNFQLQISIYGMSYETFNKFTKASKSNWEKVMNNLDILSKSSFKSNVVLCFAVNNITYNELDAFIEYANSRSFKYILNRAASIGRAVNNWGDIQLPSEKHFEFSRNTKSKSLRFCYHMCQLHISVICVNGNVIPCSFLRKPKYIFGNVFDSSIESIWKSDKYMMFRTLTPKMVEKCKSCEFMYVCTAGCCAEADGYSDNILACYPWCLVKPFENSYLDIKDNEIYEVDKLAAGTFEFRLIE